MQTKQLQRGLTARGLWVAALGLLMLAGQAHAQAPTVGVVDEDKLADGYTKYKNAVDALDQRAQGLDAQIPAREFLVDEEGKSFDSLILKSNRNAADDAALAKFVKTGLARKDTYMGLVGKATRSAEESKQMKDLQEQSTKNVPAVRKISEDLLALIRKLQEDTDKLYTENANSVVGQVAAEIRAIRPPEPYKGKGVRYSDEKITIKETKKK